MIGLELHHCQPAILHHFSSSFAKKHPGHLHVFELMLNANLALVAFSRYHGGMGGNVFVFFIITVAAAEVAVGWP